MTIKLVVFVFMFGVCAPVLAQSFEFEKLTSKEGISHNTVYDITQDDEGKIWLATREGLNSYDSYTIKTYYADTLITNKGLSNDRVLSVLYTSRGLYVGTQSGIDKYDKFKDNFMHISKGDSLEGNVLSLYESAAKNIYVCTTKGLYLLDTGNTIKQLISNQNIMAVCNFKAGVLCVALRQKIMLTNESGEIIKEYQLPVSPIDHQEGARYVINKLFKDHTGTIWVGTSRGLCKFSPADDSFEFVKIDNKGRLEANVIRDINEDNEHNIWLGTEWGVVLYNLDTGHIKTIGQSFNNDINSLTDKAVYSIFLSRENMVWIGTYFGGVNFASLEEEGFKKFLTREDGNYLRGKAISQLVESEGGKLWIGTEDGGITIYDKNADTYKYLNYENNSLSSNNVHAIQEDKDYFWIGTFLGGLNRIDKKTGQLKVYKKSTEEPSITHSNIYSIFKTSGEMLLIGTEYGLNYYDYTKDTFKPFMPEFFRDKFVYDMLEDNNKALWICTRFKGIFRVNQNTGDVLHFSANSGKTNLQSNQIISGKLDSEGNIWFGTLGGGLAKWNGNSFKIYNTENGLPNNNIYGAIEDENKHIWITSNRGLSMLNPVTDTITNYNISHGLSTNQFNFKSFFKGADGTLYFGSVNGLNYFNPKTFSGNKLEANMHLTGLKLFNKEVPIDGTNQLLTQQVDYTDTITLSHSQNVITIEFAAINFKTNGVNEYAYFLDGFEDNWNYVGNKTSATYTNLSPGEYIFKVKMLNGTGVGTEKSLHITVLPPFWKSNWALILYLLFIIGAIYGYSRFMKFVHNQKLAVELEKLEKEKIQEINKHKLNFFTFISHELKTPLTLIIASVEKYFQNKSILNNQPEELLFVKYNAKKLNNLIRQLMEFRKIETDHAKLDLRRGDVVLFLKDTYKAFIPLFEHKQISYSFKHNFSEYPSYFDASKLEMIVTNLISNAVKYTEPGGVIDVVIAIGNTLNENHTANLSITVSDTGKGMSPEQIERIFSTFYQVESEFAHVEGSGIGMALVKSLIDFLGGEVKITSEKGVGTTVVVNLSLYLKTQENENVLTIDGNKQVAINPDLILDDVQLSAGDTPIINNKNTTILLIEDNRELMKFLSKHFSDKYRVVVAKEGKEAIRKLEKSYPDLIISDVKMPVMDGITFCKKVKQNKETAYIPIILLSGRNDDLYKMEGLNVGANAYLPKPFNLKELDLLVKNLLENNKSFKDKFSGIPFLKKEVIPDSNRDMEFVKKITSLIEKNYTDPNFNIQELAEKAGISRSLLHIKMKKTMNTNGSDFIRKVRMDKAVELMEQGILISEVAYKVGYNDPNYFSRVFKKQYKTSPTSYLSKYHETI